MVRLIGEGDGESEEALPSPTALAIDKLADAAIFAALVYTWINKDAFLGVNAMIGNSVPVLKSYVEKAIGKLDKHLK